MTFLIRDEGNASAAWEEHPGDLSLGGIAYRGRTPPHGATVDVRFRLTGVPKEINCKGEFIRVVDQGRTIEFRVRFTELSAEGELAIAKYLDEWLEAHPSFLTAVTDGAQLSRSP
jgi:hypothetical protein